MFTVSSVSSSCRFVTLLCTTGAHMHTNFRPWGGGAPFKQDVITSSSDTGHYFAIYSCGPCKRIYFRRKFLARSIKCYNFLQLRNQCGKNTHFNFFPPAIVGVKQKCKGARLYWIDSQETKICVKSILKGKLWNEFPVAALENELIPSIFWDRYPITKQLVPIRISSVCSRSSITDAIKKQISLHLIGPVPATGDGGISWRFLPARPDPLEWEQKWRYAFTISCSKGCSETAWLRRIKAWDMSFLH